MLGIDRVTPNLAAGPCLFFDLAFIDWDLSLVFAILWPAVWGALFIKRGRKLAVRAGIASFSHFLADWAMHNCEPRAVPALARALRPRAVGAARSRLLAHRGSIRCGPRRVCVASVRRGVSLL